MICAAAAVVHCPKRSTLSQLNMWDSQPPPPFSSPPSPQHSQKKILCVGHKKTTDNCSSHYFSFPVNTCYTYITLLYNIHNFGSHLKIDACHNDTFVIDWGHIFWPSTTENFVWAYYQVFRHALQETKGTFLKNVPWTNIFCVSWRACIFKWGRPVISTRSWRIFSTNMNQLCGVQRK